MSTRMLGIDYGSKRVGLALSDEQRGFATPMSVAKNGPDLLTEVKELAVNNGVKEIVMGESKNYAGGANPILEKSLEFKKILEAEGFTVHLQLEFMTSMQAERVQGKTDLTDASAAALILQAYLDSSKNV